jgi:hypothetical protein
LHVRALESGINQARIFSKQVVGRTEIVLALAMIADLWYHATHAQEGE